MATITITTQAELDALPNSFTEYTRIQIKNDPNLGSILVNKEYDSAHVVAQDSAHVVAQDSAHVEAYGSAHVEAYGSAHVEAWDSAHVEAWGSAHVVAWDSAHVEAWGSAHVEAWGSAHVEARDSAGVYLQSVYASVVLYAFAACWALAKGKITNKSKTATVIAPTKPKTAEEWIEGQGVKHMKANRDYIVVYKRVSSDFKTQENTPNETTWSVGTTLEHPSYNPSSGECGEGKFHACSRAIFCDEFRSKQGDKYVAIKVNKADMHVCPDARYPHKVAFRKGKVMYECDRNGKRI